MRTTNSAILPQPNTFWGFPQSANSHEHKSLDFDRSAGSRRTTRVLLNGQKWAAPISELPKLETTEDWVIFNPTADTHPIYLHLVQFQLVQRQTFDRDAYYADWLTTNGFSDQLLNDPTDLDLHEALTNPTINVANPADYLTGPPTPPAPNEQGWKDTIQMNPGEVTTIRVRFAQQDCSKYPFDATADPGYVWHCHIIDHEDNEMMRPYMVVPGNMHVIPEAPLATLMLLSSMGVAIIGFVGFKRWRFKRQK
jgi:spore coat protein A